MKHAHTRSPRAAGIPLGTLTVWVSPPDTMGCIPRPMSADASLVELLERLRPRRCMEVGSFFGLAGLAAVQAGWIEQLVWVMRDVVGQRLLEATLAAKPISSAVSLLGEGPLDAPEDAYDAIIVHQQPSRRLTEILIQQAAARIAPDGVILLAGAVQEGVNVAAKVLAEVCKDVRTELKARGVRIFGGREPLREHARTDPAPRTVHEENVAGVMLRWVTTPGIFSADELDPASRLLLETVRLPHRGRVLDLGCGAGVMGLWAALRMPDVVVTMADSDVASVRCAEEGIHLHGLTNARIVLSDGIAEFAGERFDVVLTNPPAHRAGRRETGLVERFAREAARALGRKGRLWLVTARTVPIMRTLEELFTEVSIAADDGRFRVYDAIRRPPRHSGRGRLW